MMNWFLGFIFFACERIVVNSQVWPEGTYGLPKPAVTGCPPNWQEGWRNQDLENTNPSSSEFSIGLTSRMDATLTGGDIRRGFCVKTATQIGETSWPAGSYCVYKKYQCPFGMKSGFIEWDDDDINPNKNNVSGTLPNGTFDQDTIIRYCCQDQGRWTDSIELPVDKPFYLLPHSSQDCQRVKGAISTLDYIIYDTENDNNYDKFSGNHVFTNKVESLPKIYYCYYKGCQHKLQKESGTISTTHFPDYQYCSWSITVNQGSAVSLTFTSINIPSCDGNHMNIYDGSDDTAPIIMSICGDNATAGIRLRSTGNNMFIMLRSGQNSLNGENIQFQADFKTTAPYSGPSWPSGTYGLPKTNTSCPDMWIPGWRKQIMEDDHGKGETSLSTDLLMHMDVAFVDHALTRHFCTKTIDSGGSQKAWPAGKYCIYKKNQCPSSMKDGFIKWDDEDRPNKGGNDKHGILPDGEYGAADTKIFYCCNDAGDWKQSIELPIHEPFFLLPYQSKNCQRVKGALSKLETITYDTEEDNNHDDFKRSHTFTDSQKGKPTLYYCYYKGCEYKLETNSGSFGANNYPAYQYCSWSITVKHGLEVFLKFTTLNIPDCSENQLEVYDGVDNTGSLLAVYCAKNATSGNTVRSTGNNMYVMFKSGNDNSGSLQFQAQYEAKEPITGPSWPSGTYGLPKTNTSCPAMWIPGWRKQIMEDDEGKGETSLSTDLLMHMGVAFVDHALTRHFCTKTIDSRGSQKAWPAGKYCIYKKNQCPSSMKDGFIKWDDEDYPKKGGNDKHGILPDGEYGAADTNDRDTKIFYCCNDAGDWKQSIELPIHEPFYLLPYQSKNCQRVKGALSTLETITYDTEKDNNQDDFQTSHAFTDGQKGKPTLYYCYYKGCQYKRNAESSSYISVSTAANQDFQNCSWLLSVRYGNITLTFNSMSVPDCSNDFIEIYDGSSDQSVSLAKYCGRPTPTSSITSTGKHLLILVKSGNNKQMGTTVSFFATYKNNLPFGFTVPPATTGITTGKTTMRSSTTLATTRPTTPTTSSATTSTKTSPKTSPTTSQKTSPTTSPTTSLTTSPTTSPSTAPTTSPTTPPQTSPTPPPQTLPTTEILTSKLPTSVRKTTPKRELSTTSAPTKEMPSPATVKVSTEPDITTPRSDVFSSETPQTKTSTEPDMTFTSEEKVQSTSKAGIEGGPGKSSGDGNGSSTALAIVIPLCITFLVTVFIVMFFYRRRKMKGNSTERSTDRGNELPSPQFNARFQSPDKVSIIQKDGQRVNMPANEKDNPLYEPGGENHTYCSIEDTQAQYKKEIGLTAKPSQSTLYETPVDPGASTSSNPMPNPYQISPLTTSSPPKLPPKDISYETPVDPGASISSFNPLYSKGSDNTSPNTPTFPFPSPSDSDTPLLSTSYDTPQSHYKTPNNPYDTMIPKDTQGAYAVSPMNQPPRASYENVPNGNNNPHYQTPSTKPEGNVYEVMHGRDPQVNLPDNTGVTQC